MFLRPHLKVDSKEDKRNEECKVFKAPTQRKTKIDNSFLVALTGLIK
jgi:hypothetical protein